MNGTALGLIDKIYDSIIDPSPARWQSFLEDFLREIRASRGTLLLKPPGDAELGVACWAGWSDDDVRTYLSKYGPVDPWSSYVARQPEGSVKADFEYCPRDVAESSEAFREFYGPRDAVHGMGGIILISNAGQTAIAAVRGREAGPFGEKEKSILRALMPHLRRAVLIYGEIFSVRRRLAMFTEHLDRYTNALFLTDAKASIMYANSAGVNLVAREDGIRIEGNRLILHSRQHDTSFRKAVQEMSAGRGPRLLRFAAPSRSRPLPYRMILISASDSSALPLGGNMPAITLLVIDPMSVEPNPEALSEPFLLTPTEARVACKLAIGWSLEEIASDSGTSLQTVRTHVKRLLSKTGTVRQGELISLIWRSTPMSRA